jgi:hypothetical protein
VAAAVVVLARTTQLVALAQPTRAGVAAAQDKGLAAQAALA